MDTLIFSGSSRKGRPLGRPSKYRPEPARPRPIGLLTLVAEDGALVGLYMDAQHNAPPTGASELLDARSADGFGPFVEQLLAYFAGELRRFDVPLAPVGTPFQQRVWAALREIPFGETATYGELAAAIGQPGAARAVGLANGRNPIGIIVPCHRVIGTDGKLRGYAGGVDRKERLLALERRAL